MDLLKAALLGTGVAGALYLALSPKVAMRLYNSQLFNPFKFPEGEYQIDQVSGIAKEDVFFTSLNGTKLHGWFFRNPQAKLTVLFHHGNGGNLSGRMGLVSMLLELGLSVFIYDFQGYGLSDGSPSIEKILQDGEASYNYLIEKEGLKPEQIVIYGESLGTAVASHVASKFPALGLVLQSGFASLRLIGSQRLPLLKIYPQSMFPKLCLDTLSIVQSLQMPLLIIHGINDGTVPYSHAEVLFNGAMAPKKLITLSNANHIDLKETDEEAYKAAIKGFIEELQSQKTEAQNFIKGMSQEVSTKKSRANEAKSGSKPELSALGK